MNALIRKGLLGLGVTAMLSGCYVPNVTWNDPLKPHQVTSQDSDACGAPVHIPKPVKIGTFGPSDHSVSGRVTILEDEGKLTLRLEDFTTENAPDLLICFGKNLDGSIHGADDHVELGRPKSTNGTMTYPLPDGTDPATIKSVIVWCRALNVTFGVAPLP